MINFRKPGRVNGLPHAPRVFGQPLNIGKGEFLPMILDEEKPITTPRNIAADPRVNAVVFDSSTPPPQTRAVYLTGTAAEVPGSPQPLAGR